MKFFFTAFFSVFISCFIYGQAVSPAGPVNLCPGGSQVLSVTGGTVSSWEWFQGTTQVGTAPTYLATTAGSYTVVINGGGPGDTLGPVLVVAQPNPVAAFTFSPNNQCGNVPITFQNLSTGTGLSYTWNFGDPNSGANNTSTATNPSHHFIGNPGIGTQSFTVTLTATSSFGCTSTITNTTITIKQTPDLTLGGPGATLYNGLHYFKKCASGVSTAQFDFTNQSTTAATNTSYQIVFGDASPDYISPTFTTVSHNYGVGTHTLLFIVDGPNGCKDTAAYYIFVGSNPAVGLGNPGNTAICNASTLTFPISATFTNPPGTIYTVTFNDGTAPVSFPHPAPADISHNFQITSCGTNSPGYPNSFSATIQASNPCASSTATVVPIYVSQRPVADFSIAPKDTVCVNNIVTFTNTSGDANDIDNGTCVPGKFVWTISPATGWTIASGGLGNDFGLTDPTTWQTGTTNLGINFNTPGTYTIKIKIGNLTCGQDSITKTICVNPLPTGNFAVDQTTGCAPVTVNTTTTTNTALCGVNRYLWTVNYVPTSGCTPATGNYIYLNGTNASSAEPQFQFNDPGVYTIGLVFIAPAASCSSAVITQVITVKGKPVVTLAPFTAICVGATINPSATSTCYPATNTYAWSFPGGSPVSSTNASPGPITYNTAGPYTVSLGVTNECGTTNASQPLTVNNVTTATAGPAQTLCGSSVTMAANTAIIGTGTWTQTSGPNIAVITNPTSPTTTITGLIPGTYVFTWTINNSGCSSSSNVTINISTGPTTANAGADIGLCQANTATLNANTAVIGTGVWTQVSGPAATITNPASPNTTVTGLTTGIYVFQWTISFSNCTPSSDNVQVTIYQNPTTAAAGNDQVICTSSTTMAANTAAVGTGAWTQVSGPAATITTPASPTTTITGLTPGIYVFRWTISNGACTATTDDVQVTVTNIPTTANAGTDQSLCAVTAATLAGNTAVSGTGQWAQVSGPNTAVITSPALPNTTVTGLIPGIYIFSWTIGNGVCPSNSDNVQVSVYDNATVADAGPAQVKCGTSVTMAANTPLVGTGLWTQVSGAAATITTPGSPTTTITGLTPGPYVFQWKITNGACSSTSTVNITISTGPTVAAAGPDQDLCLATAATLAANNPATGTGQWTQISGPAATITNPALPNTTVTGLVVGTYVFRWTTSFSNCTPSTDDVQVRIFDNPTVAAAGIDQDICLPNTTLTGNTAVIGSGQWTQVSGPGIATIATPNAATTAISGLVPGVYVFAWTISNGPCPASTDNVQVSYSVIANNSISGSTAVCINTAPSTITGSTPSGSVGTYTYQWQVSTDGGATWNNIPAATGIDYSPGALTVNTCYRRIVTTTLCSGPQGSPSNTLCITVNPDARALFTASSTLLCAPVNLDTIISVTAFPLQNQQYNWYHDNILIPGTVNGLPPSYVIATPGQTVVIKLVTSSPFGCKPDSMSITFNTRPSVTADFIKDTASGCGPLTVTFTNTSTILNNSIEYYWNFGNGVTLSNVIQPPSPIVYTASPEFRDTTYYITLKAFSGCDTTYKRDSVKIYADPNARFTALAIGCSPFPDTLYNNSQGQDAFTVYYWDLGDGTLDTTYTTGPLYHTYITGVIDTFHVQLIMVNRCASDTQRMDIIVSPSNIVEHIVVNGTQQYGCAPHTVNFQNSSVGASVLYWDFGDGSPVEAVPNTQATITHTYLTGGVFNVHITLENYCSDTTVDKQVTVYDPPAASFTLSSQNICTGNSVNTNNTSVNANSYEWFWGDNTSTAGFNATHIYATGGTYFVRLVARKLNAFGVACTDTSAPVQVRVVDRIPAVVDISPATSPCVPYTITVSAANAGAATQIDWYFYDINTAPGIFHVSGPAATYIYNFDGIDSVKLVITNAAGCKDSSVKQFTVHKTPKAVFTPINIKTCNTDTTASFNVSVDYSGTDPVSYEWFVNDVSAGNSNPFVYHFQAPGGVTAVNVFSIKVLVKNSVGCGDTASFGNFIIQTLGPRKIVVSPSLVQVQPNYTFSFTDTATVLPNSTYLWSPGDHNNQQLPGKDITYSYGDTGTYHVKLLVHDYETGCDASDSVNVFVIPVPGYLYVPSAFCPGCYKAELRQFLPLGKGLKDYHLVIFNIWGQKVFETSSLDANGVPNEPWDGNWKDGKNIQQGAFSWYIEAHYINGTEWKGMPDKATGKLKKQGFVTIIR